MNKQNPIITTFSLTMIRPIEISASVKKVINDKYHIDYLLSEYPLCVNCRYYQKIDVMPHDGRCMKFAKISLVDGGKITDSYCSIERLPEGKCRDIGVYFKAQRRRKSQKSH